MIVLQFHKYHRNKIIGKNESMRTYSWKIFISYGLVPFYKHLTYKVIFNGHKLKSHVCGRSGIDFVLELIKMKELINLY